MGRESPLSKCGHDQAGSWAPTLSLCGMCSLDLPSYCDEARQLSQTRLQKDSQYSGLDYSDALISIIVLSVEPGQYY